MFLRDYLLTAHELFQSETPAKRGGVGDSNAGYPYNTYARNVRRCIWVIHFTFGWREFCIDFKMVEIGFCLCRNGRGAGSVYNRIEQSQEEVLCTSVLQTVPGR